MTGAMPFDDPLTPPTSGTLAADEPRTKWPTVIGVISTIYACLGITCMGLGAVGTWFGEMMYRVFGMDVTVPTIIKVTTVLSCVLGIILGIILFVGGLRLVKRRRSGVKLLKMWVVMRIVLVLIGVVLAVLTMPAQIQYQRAINEATNKMLRENGNPEQPFNEATAQRQIFIFSGIGAAVVSIYPIFLGLYLTRKTIDAEIEPWPS